MQGLCYGFAALLLAASCANDDTVQEGKQKENNIPAGATVFTGTSQPGTTTRTAILNHKCIHLVFFCLVMISY